MVRVVTKIGDVYSVALDDQTKKYFQYVADDHTQLNSYVIRAFKKSYPIDANPDLSEIIKGEVDFYAHVFLKIGVKLNVWKKVGKISDVGTVDVFFRGTNDYGSRPGEQVKVSHNWHVWRINEPFLKVGRLEGIYRNAEIGVVVNPYDVVTRMRTGKYDFKYPEFE